MFPGKKHACSAIWFRNCSCCSFSKKKLKTMAVFRWSVPGVVTGKAPQQLVVWCVPTSTRDEAGWKGAEVLKREAAVNRPPPLVAKRGPSSKHTSVAARTSDTFPPCYLMLKSFNVSCHILSNISVTWGQTTENMLRLCNCWPPSNSSSKPGKWHNDLNDLSRGQ